MLHSMMIVDDSAVIRSRILRAVSDSRLPDIRIVGLAGDGEQAVSIARDKQPGLVTMDLTMPNMDGEACIEALSAIIPDARILVVSALADRNTALRAIRKGAQGFLHKPFSDEELVDALLELMN